MKKILFSLPNRDISFLLSSWDITFSFERLHRFELGAVHILRNTGWGGRGLPDLLQYYIGGGLPNLLQYYSFERKMESYNPFSALNKLKVFHFILFNADLCLRVLSRIRKNVANTRF